MTVPGSATKDPRERAPVSGDFSFAQATLASRGVGLWEWDVENDVLSWGPGCEQILEFGDASPPARLAELARRIADSQQGAFETAWRAAAASPSAPLQHNTVWRCNSMTLEFVGQASVNAKPTKLAGFVRTTSDPPHKDSTCSAPAAPSEAETRLRALIDNAPICVHEIDLDGRITSMNRTGLQMMGLDDAAQICGVAYVDCTNKADRSRISDLLNRAFDGEASEFEFTTDDPENPKTFSSCFVPMRDESGAVYRLMGITSDVTARRNADLVRRRTEERYQLAQRIAGVGVWEWDLDSNQVFLSDEAKRILAFPIDRSDFLIESLVNRIDSAHRTGWQASVDRCLAGGDEHNLEFRMLAPDGAEQWISTLANTKCDDSGQPTHMVGVMIEVTERKRNELALLESEERFQLAVRGSTDGIWDWNIETGDVFYSVRYKELLGYDGSDPFSSDLVGFTDTLHPDDLEETWQRVNQHLERGAVYDHEFRMRTKGGDYRWFRARGQAVWNAHGAPTRMAGSIQDVTAKRDAERLLLEVVNLVPHEIFAKDSAGRFVLSNRKHASDFGLTPEEVVGKSQMDLTPDPAEAAAFLADDRSVIRSGHSKFIPEEDYTRPDGSQIVLQTHKIPLSLPGSQQPNGVLGVAIDITELKMAEALLRDSEEQFRSLVETTSDWVWEMSLEGYHTYSNRQIERILGYSSKEFESIQVFECFAEEDRESIAEMVRDAVAARRGWTNFVIRMRTKSGQWRYLESSAAPVLDGQERVVGFRGIDRDVTDRILAEEALARTQSLLGAAIESPPTAILIVDPEGFIQTANTAAKYMTGDPNFPLEGHKFADVIGQFDVCYPDGRKVPIDEFPVLRSLKGEVCRSVDMLVVNPEGPDVWTLVNSAPVQDPQGQIIAAVAIISDVTQLKDAVSEREKLIVELGDKNAELERFTYTVSHDLKSPLITIKGFLGLLERELKQNDLSSVDARLHRIRGAADQMSRLLDELLELSRIGRVDHSRQPASFSEIAHEAQDLVAASLEARQVDVQIQSNLPVVLVDRKRFIEVFQNLLDNACRFVGDTPQPKILVGMRVDEGESVYFVQDNGVGIPKEYQEKVLGLFEQLNPELGGTGIGLAIVKRIIEVHNGQIWIESDGLGKGTTVCFTIGANQD